MTSRHGDLPRKVTLATANREPLLVNELKAILEHGLRNLPKRYPGLKIVSHSIFPDKVEMVLDFQRLDEDVMRVVQSLKAEVKTLAKMKGVLGDFLWQWNYEDEEAEEAEDQTEKTI